MIPFLIVDQNVERIYYGSLTKCHYCQQKKMALLQSSFRANRHVGVLG